MNNSKDIEKDSSSSNKESDRLTNNINDKVKQDEILTYQTMLTTFQGPLPHPDILKGYNEVVPNGAERIFALAEKQTEHRMSLERKVIDEEIRLSLRGQNFGFILGLTGLTLSALLAFLGHEVVAGIFASTTIIGLVTVFVVGKKLSLKDDDSSKI